jgi:hypothetical protein
MRQLVVADDADIVTIDIDKIEDIVMDPTEFFTNDEKPIDLRYAIRINNKTVSFDLSYSLAMTIYINLTYAFNCKDSHNENYIPDNSVVLIKDDGSLIVENIEIWRDEMLEKIGIKKSKEEIKEE